MKLDKIYIGYTKDYEELLLEDKGTFYVDLLSNEMLFRGDLYLNLLMPITKLDNVNKQKLLCSIKRLYAKDRSQMLDMRKVFVAPVHQIVEVSDKKFSYDPLGNFQINTTGKLATLDDHALLYKKNDYEYRNIQTEEDYIITPSLEDGNSYIDMQKINTFYKELMNGCNKFVMKFYEEKKKVLEKYNEFYKKGVK